MGDDNDVSVQMLKEWIGELVDECADAELLDLVYRLLLKG